MDAFLVGKKRDLSHHVSRGMRFGRTRRFMPYVKPKPDLTEVLFTRALQRNLRMAKRALADKRVRSVLRRMRQYARSNDGTMSAERRRQLRTERELDRLGARQNEAIRNYWNNIVQRGGQYVMRAVGGGVVPALQAAWRNRHTRAVPAAEQYRDFVGHYYQ